MSQIPPGLDKDRAELDPLTLDALDDLHLGAEHYDPHGRTWAEITRSQQLLDRGLRANG